MTRDEILAAARLYPQLLLKPLSKRVKGGEVTIISLGGHCATAGFLKETGLRQAAYPFDWLFSSLEMVDHCLSDDFATFLNPEHHEPVALHSRVSKDVQRAHHAFYRRNFGIEYVFNHHEMPDELDHFKRTVERFRSAPNPVFLYMARQSPKLPTLQSVARRLPGPFLAVHVVADGGVSISDDGPLTKFRSMGDLGAVGLHQIADTLVLATWLQRRIDHLVG